MRILAIAVLTVPFSVLAAPAFAQQTTYVAANGIDSRPCTVEANPCRTLTRGIAAVQLGGEVRVLSNLPNEVVTIPKSLTIDGNGNTLIGRLIVNQIPAVVAIRNLNLNGRNSSTTGITITRAAALHLENVSVERYTLNGIDIGSITDTEVFVSGSSIHDNDNGIVHFGTGNMTLVVVDTQVEHNGSNGIYAASGSVSLLDTVLSGNGNNGFRIDAGAALVTGTTAASNDNHGFDIEGGNATIVSSVARDNTGTNFCGLIAQGASTVTIAHSVFTGNHNGVCEVGSGAIQTLRNASFDPDLFTNFISGNTTGNVSGTLGNVDAQ